MMPADKNRLEHRTLPLHITSVRDALRIGRFTQKTVRYRLARHVHDNRKIEFCYLDKGRQNYVIGGRPVSLRGGEVCVILPGQEHRAGEGPEAKGDLYYAVFNLPLSGDRFMNLSGPEIPVLIRRLRSIHPQHFPGTPSLRAHIQAAMDAYDRYRSSPLAGLEIQAHLIQFLLEALDGSEKHRRRSLSWRTERVVQEIEAHLPAPVSVAQMAKWAGLSVPRFQVLFKQDTGASPAVYVTSRRVEFAKRMLQDDPRASVTEIAIESGFSSSQHFATVFKRYTGVNPKDFRTAVLPPGRVTR